MIKTKLMISQFMILVQHPKELIMHKTVITKSHSTSRRQIYISRQLSNNIMQVSSKKLKINSNMCVLTFRHQQQMESFKITQLLTRSSLSKTTSTRIIQFNLFKSKWASNNDSKKILSWEEIEVHSFHLVHKERLLQVQHLQ